MILAGQQIPALMGQLYAIGLKKTGVGLAVGKLLVIKLQGLALPHGLNDSGKEELSRRNLFEEDTIAKFAALIYQLVDGKR